MFQRNAQHFATDDTLSKVFCDEAVSRSVLTRHVEGNQSHYRFVHERVHRFFVARHLVRQDSQDILTWHARLAAGFGRSYWADVLEFIGAIHAAAIVQFSDGR
jgi:hypothetical protein